ncbi:MAG: mycothiol system anti-sigma-R factor [Actinomycetota bacterium]
MSCDCRDVLERAYLFLDKEGLSEAERQEIQQHLDDCSSCFERLGLETEVNHLIARLKSGPACPERLKAKILTLLDQD